MKLIYISMLLLLSVLMVSGNSYSQNDIPIPDDPILAKSHQGNQG